MESQEIKVCGDFAIVCDGACDIPERFFVDHQVRMVPFHVRLGSQEFLDRKEDIPEDFYGRLSVKRELPRTSYPSVAEFGEVYQDLIDGGCTKILSVHLSSQLSGSYQSALSAAADFQDQADIAVIDSQTASAAEGIMVAEAVSMREAGCSFEDVCCHVKILAETTAVYFIPTKQGTLTQTSSSGRSILGRFHRMMDSFLDMYFLEEIGDSGNLEFLGSAPDLKAASGRLARLMSRKSHALGNILYVELFAGDKLTLKQMEKPLDTNEFKSVCAGVAPINACETIKAGIGSVGVALIPENVLFSSEFIRTQVWNSLDRRFM